MRKTIGLGLAAVALASSLAVAAPAVAAPTATTPSTGASAFTDRVRPRPELRRDRRLGRRAPFLFHRRAPFFFHRRPVQFSLGCDYFLYLGDVEDYLLCVYGGEGYGYGGY